MKILFIQPTADKKGHYGIYTVNLCQELAKRGNEVWLFTNKVYPERFISDPPLFKIIEVKDGMYKFDKFDQKKKTIPFFYEFGYLKNSFIILKSALEFLRKNNFDIVQIMDVEYGILSFLLREYREITPPVVLLINAPNFSFLKYSGPIWLRMYKSIQRRFFRKRIGNEIKAIVTLGEFHREELKKQFNLPESFPIKVIYDGATPPSLHLNKQEARSRIGVNYQGPLFLFWGILRKDKGLEYLLKAVSLLKEKHFKVLIAGFPFDYTKKDILTLISKLNLENKLILRLEYIESKEVPFYFYASDALVLPYLKIYTGGSGPLLKEAAIFKKPVIVSEVSEMGRLVKKYKMGLIAEAENPQSLAEKMKEFLKMSEKQQKEFGENAFKVANTWEKMAKEYQELYREIYYGKN